MYEGNGAVKHAVSCSVLVSTSPPALAASIHPSLRGFPVARIRNVPLPPVDLDAFGPEGKQVTAAAIPVRPVPSGVRPFAAAAPGSSPGHKRGDSNTHLLSPFDSPSVAPSIITHNVH